jgi:glycine/D-amino acid oxidase-like deaminating enzyme
LTADLFAPDFKQQPYWWDDVTPSSGQSALPGKADVVVIGSGYTGLSAALQTARAGRNTVVIDAEAAGWGCSSRNGGQIGPGIKPSYHQLAKIHGADRALEILKEGNRALDYIEDFIRSESVSCDWEKVGRFVGAHNEAAYRSLIAALQAQPKELNIQAHVMPRAEQRREIGSDAYHGGLVYPTHSALHPAKYHQALLGLVRSAGATIVERCPVTGVEKSGDLFEVKTVDGKIVARDVIVATNGYSGKAAPFFQRRVIPIGSYIIATEPLDRSITSKLIPNARVISNTTRLVSYYRLSPDRSRVIFGGRVALSETDSKITAPRLHAELTHLFPELSATRISRAWPGFVAYTFDTMPHIGADRDGLHYAMGYCGSGIALSSYFGMRVGQKVLGSSEGRTAFDGFSFPTRPLYSGKPWFLAAAVAWYRLRDRINL